MVVLAASITTTSGKPILSRQFKDLTKDRVLELLSNFQNLVSSVSKDHTFIEDEHVRYVYKPFDDYYIILITNRQSNIIQDLNTLNLFAETINDYLNGLNEFELFDNAFDILNAFDEIVVMGYKENLLITQVNTYLAMESHEERIQDIIERNKEIEATEERKRRAKEIARKEQERKHGFQAGFPSDFNQIPQNKFAASNDPNAANALNSYYSHASAAAQQSFSQSKQHNHHQGPQHESTTSNMPRSGMKLSASSNVRRSAAQRSSAVSAAATATANNEPKPNNNGILVTLKETLKAQFSREGDIQSSELKGALELRINNAELAHTAIELTNKEIVKDRSYRFETHPNIDKKFFLSNGVVSLRDKSKAFPANDQARSVLRWRKIGTQDDRSIVPLIITPWVSESDTAGLYDVNIEFEINPDIESVKTLQDIYFVIPVLPQTDVALNEDSNECAATIVSIDDEQGIVIKIDKLAQGDSGVVNFVVDADSEDSLFPMSVSFKNDTPDNNSASLVGVAIQSITDSHDEAHPQLPYDVITSLRTDEYVVV